MNTTGHRVISPLAPPALPGGVEWRERDEGQAWQDVAAHFGRVWGGVGWFGSDQSLVFAVTGCPETFEVIRRDGFQDIVRVGARPAWVKRVEE